VNRRGNESLVTFRIYGPILVKGYSRNECNCVEYLCVVNVGVRKAVLFLLE
jgi:hypothetical protein